MRLARQIIGSLIFWGCAIGAFAQAPSPPSPAGPQPVFSRERSFRIPYRVDPAVQARIKEVQLAVSTDRGSTWRQCATGPAPKDEEFFTFTAQGDGEHWFTVRTVDFEGRGTPPTLNGQPPQCVVLVDTTAPQVDLRSLGFTGDEAGIKWTIYDQNLDVGTMRIEFRAGSAEWYPVPFQPVAEGTTRFKPGARGPIELRLRVLDRAGNESVQQVNLQMPGGPQGMAASGAPGMPPAMQPYPPQGMNPSSGSNPARGIPAFGGSPPPQQNPIGGGYAPSNGMTPPVANNPAGPSMNLPPGMDNSRPVGQNGGSSFTPANPGGFSVPPPPNVGATMPAPMAPNGMGAPNLGTNPAPSPSPAPNNMNAPDLLLPQTMLSDQQNRSRPMSPNGNVNGMGNPAGMPQGHLVSNPGAPPVRNNLQLVNSTRFGINYEIAEIGRSGLGGISLYWSYDGNTWNYHGDDEDLQSPFAVEVDGEGTFGFKIVARSKAGLGDDPPRAGDQPDVWVEVDITPPEIDLKPPQPGRGASSGVLDIEWQARDKNPAPKPICLYYSEEASGPWKPIAEGIENSGRYQWQIPSDPSMPYKFFVRIECKDRAGNTGRTETPTQVIVDLTRPKIRILRVEPSSKSNSDISVTPLPP